ncbi:unnamed protein product [Urochloa decumbens]|uniref:Bet v I/Major latex protein domain-containing protein n=1 Tax=Urochloa decumbens TaxID=240449 RepID=A0ABC9F7C7_9POAL
MKGSKSHEVGADGVTASALWDIYATLRFVQLFHELLPQVLRKVDVARGDGGVGTVIQVTVVPPGNPGAQPMTYQEEFIKIDNENRVKEAVVVAGDILKLGFTKYLTRLEIIEKGPCSSVIRSTIEYEFDDGRPELEDSVSTAPLDAAAEKIVQYLKEQKAT